MDNVNKTIDEKIAVLNIQFEQTKSKVIKAEIIVFEGKENLLKISGAFKILEDLKKDLAEQETNIDG